MLNSSKHTCTAQSSLHLFTFTEEYPVLPWQSFVGLCLKFNSTGHCLRIDNKIFFKWICTKIVWNLIFLSLISSTLSFCSLVIFLLVIFLQVPADGLSCATKALQLRSDGLSLPSSYYCESDGRICLTSSCLEVIFIVPCLFNLRIGSMFQQKKCP